MTDAAGRRLAIYGLLLTLTAVLTPIIAALT